MEKTANVTVVIPNYNGIKYIDNCLKSLIDGETVPEIIVVDNGSRDGSAEIVEKKYPMCRLVRFKENRGFCHAVNEGYFMSWPICIVPIVKVRRNSVSFHT